MKKYVAYVGTYTHGDHEGIHIYDMDLKKGDMTERKIVPIHNASYLKRSNNNKYIYSICDEGVAAFQILKDGDLKELNIASIRGMRGCYLSTDKKDQYLFVGGHHDGKVTVMRLNEDGSVGDITDEIFHQGVGSIVDRNFRPHIDCIQLTPDEKFLCAVDSGLDQIKIYRFDKRNGKIKMIDFVPCALESAPHRLRFSADGKFAYVICEQKNVIYVYTYKCDGNAPEFEEIQCISTLKGEHDDIASAACAMRFTEDGNYLFCSNAGENNVTFYSVDKETGLLNRIRSLPISGDYPKDIMPFPDGHHLICCNHETNQMTFFRVDYDKGLLIGNAKPIAINKPNSIIMAEMPEK